MWLAVLSLWSASCPVAMHDGLCVRFARAAPTACDQKRDRWIAVPRDPVLVKKALAAMPEAEAKLARADLELEAAIADALPRLHFGRPDPSKRSSVRFESWLHRQNQRREKLLDRYVELHAFGRIGQLSLVLASQLVTAPIPHGIAEGRFAQEKRDAYCDQMTRFVEPLLARALEQFARCAEMEPATTWNAMCVRELETMDPVTFPPMREKLPKPSVTGGIDIALEGEPQQ